MEKKVLLFSAAVTSSIAAIKLSTQRIAFAESPDGGSGSSSSWWKTLMNSFKSSKVISDLPLEAKELLLMHQHTKEIDKGCLIKFETNFINANCPIEDRHTECYFPITNSFFFGTMDGHSGWHCSETLRHRLPLYTAMCLASYLKCSPYKVDVDNFVQQIGQSEKVFQHVQLPSGFENKQNTLKSSHRYLLQRIPSKGLQSLADTVTFSYNELDRDICNEAIPVDRKADESLLIGVAGSCAISAVVQDKSLLIASTGDCRAVIGRCDANGNYFAMPMSVDQTVSNQSEVKRLKDEHRGEEGTVVMFDRLLGQLQPLRAFGDVCYKWSKKLHESVLDIAYGRPVVPRHIYRSPPYLTASPVITEKILDNQDQFLIIATDGLWDTVSSDKAVKIIGEHFKELSTGEISDINGATKLIRYCLSKNNNQTLMKVLSLPNSYKREVHDDITVTVIYFKHIETSSKL